MSTEPNGWQAPKTNWKAADVVLPGDLNRIEGNINALDNGARTLDPAQAPSGNVGSLRQILDWLANRIQAITGATNWYDAPPYVLGEATSSATANRLMARDAQGRAKVAAPNSSDDIARKAEVDTVQASVNNHANATSVHGATSEATANRIIIRDANGRAKVASPAASDDIARKAEVDAALSAAQAYTDNVFDISDRLGVLNTVDFPSGLQTVGRFHVTVPDGKSLKVKQARWWLHDADLRLRVAASSSWESSSYAGEAAPNATIASGGGTVDVTIALNNLDAPVSLAPYASWWIRFIIE